MQLNMLFVSSVGAATIQHWKVYLAVFDQYKVTYQQPTGTQSMLVNFTSPTGVNYDITFSPPSGTVYLTCKGVYDLIFRDAASNEIGSFMGIETDKIKKGTCSSYDNPQGSNSINAGYTTSDDGKYSLYFDRELGSTDYTDIYLNDELITSTIESFFYDVPKGVYTLVRKDVNGDVLSVSDLVIPNIDDLGSDNGGNDGGNDEACATLICECIQQLQSALSGKFDVLSDQLSTLNGTATAIKNDFTQQLQDNQQIINELKDVNTELDNINRHLTPSSNPTFDTIDVPDLEDFGGNINVDRQTDNTIYFEDAGQAADPGLLPPISEPNFDWSDGDITVSPTDQIIVDDPVEVSEPLDVFDALIPSTPLQPEEQDFELRWKSEQYGNGGLK